MSFRAASSTALPTYTAGAHIEFDLGSAGKRSYSLIDWPGVTSAAYTIAVQVEHSGKGGSQAMHALSVGEIVEATVPVNNFELDDGADNGDVWQVVLA